MEWDSELLLKDTQSWTSELGRHRSADTFTEEELSSEGGLGGGQAGLMIVVRERVGVMEKEIARGVKKAWGVLDECEEDEAEGMRLVVGIWEVQEGWDFWGLGASVEGTGGGAGGGGRVEGSCEGHARMLVG